MAIDRTIISVAGQSLIDTVDSDTSVEDLLSLAKAVSIGDMKNVVGNVDALPDLALGNVSEGTMYYVNEVGQHVVATKTSWVGVDGRTLRVDYGQSPMYTMGYEVAGSLATLFVGDRSSPAQEFTSATAWCQVVTGRWSTHATTIDGGLYSAGYGARGQIGNNCSNNIGFMTQEITNNYSWICVGSGYESVNAIKADGTLWSFGQGTAGQLGNNCTICYSSPVQEASSATDWCHVSTGQTFFSAIKTNGTLWSAGQNSYGNLGLYDNASSSSPVQEISSATDWCFSATGNFTTLLLRTDGSMWGLGHGRCGQLGTNDIINYSSPVQEITSATDWCCVAAGGAFASAAIKTNNTLWTFGENNTSGTLATNNAVNYSSPVQEITSATDWCHVSAGFTTMVAVKNTGTLWGWGDNYRGQLGVETSGSTAKYSSPVQEITSATDWCYADTAGYDVSFRGNGHTAAIKYIL